MFKFYSAYTHAHGLHIFHSVRYATKYLTSYEQQLCITSYVVRKQNYIDPATVDEFLPCSMLSALLY